MSASAPIQDIRELCNLYIADVLPNDILSLFIAIGVINTAIFFSLWLPLIIGLNIQSHHRLKRLSGILLRHRLAWFIVWPFLHTCCGFSLIVEALLLHAGLACRRPFYSLTPVTGWLIFACQCTTLIVSALTIGICLRKEQKKARKGKGRATAGGDNAEQHDDEPFAIPAQEGSLRTFRVLRGEDQHHRPSTVTTNSSGSHRLEYFCWEGIDDLTRPVNVVEDCRTRDPRDADPDFTYAMARRTVGRTSDKVTMEDMQHPKRVRLPVGRNAEGSYKDVESLVARRNWLAADVEGYPFPPMLPPRCLSRAGILGRNGEYIPLASEPFERNSERPLGNRWFDPMGSRSFVPSRPSPLRIDSGYQPKSEGVTATVSGGCRLDKLRGKGKAREAVMFEMTEPRSENVLASLSRVTTSSSTSGLEPLQRCPRPPLPDTSLMSPDSGVGFTEMV